MLSSIVQSSTIPVLEQVVNFAQARHAILAGNVANLDTPGYRVRDISPEIFQDRLREVVKARSSDRPSADGQQVEIDDAMKKVRESIKSILFHDGSDVGIEHQVAEISKNQSMHNLAISLMNKQFRMLETAISERV